MEFEVWYRSRHRRLVATLAAVCGDVELAADCAAEAFSRALERWSRVGEMESPEGWVYRVALNEVRRRAGRRRLERAAWQRRADETIPGPSDPRPELWCAVAELPPRQRLAIALRYIGDLTEAEVAEAMRVAPGTIAATLHQARASLARRLQMDSVENEEHEHG